MNEMQEMQDGMDSRARQVKKKAAKVKAKARMRVALGLQGQDEEGATGPDLDLFSLARIKSKAGAYTLPISRSTEALSVA